MTAPTSEGKDTHLSPCANCTLGCCRMYRVTVTGYDAWVIASGLNMAPEQFLVSVPQGAPNGYGFLLDGSGSKYEIALDKQRVESEAAPCVFWLELPGGIGRCGIYSLRPFVCQTYPAYFPAGNVVRREDVLCPDDAWRDGVLARPLWRDRLLRMQVEFDIYGLAVARWNYHVQHTAQHTPVSVLSYYTYLMNYYTRLDLIRNAVGAGEWKAMSEVWGLLCAKGASPLIEDLEQIEPWAQVVEAVRAVAHTMFADDTE